MTDLRWSDVYTYACKAFGQTPRPEDEAAIIEAFEENPLLVMRMIDDVANALNNNEIKWAWSTFASRTKRAPGPSREVIIDDTNLRQQRIAKAEKYIRATLAHLDREDELLDELFGDSGRLRDYAQVDLENIAPDDQPAIWVQSEIKGDRLLAEQMLELWRQARPAGEQIEADAHDRAEKWKAQQVELAQRKQPEPKPYIPF